SIQGAGARAMGSMHVRPVGEESVCHGDGGSEVESGPQGAVLDVRIESLGSHEEPHQFLLPTEAWGKLRGAILVQRVCIFVVVVVVFFFDKSCRERSVRAEWGKASQFVQDRSVTVRFRYLSELEDGRRGDEQL